MNTEEELVASIRQGLEYSATDEELVRAVDKAISESQELKTTIDKIGKNNKLYWAKGTAKDMSRWHPKRSRTVNNRIFTDVETAIPIITSEPPEPEIIGNFDNATKETLHKALLIAYEVKYKFQSILQKLIRHWFLYRIGIIKYRWDKEQGFQTENIIPKKIGFDKRATSMDNCEFFWEEIEEKQEDVLEKFPKKKKELLELYGDSPKSKVKYVEFWGGNAEFVCWKVNNIILDKKKNPNFDYENEENNVFEKPQFPYLVFSVFAFGDETGLYDETSLIEETIPLQDGVNQLEQQIIDLNEGQKRVWVGSGEGVSAKQFQELVNKTGDLGVYLDRKAPANSVTQVQSGKPDASLFNNLSHLLGEIDNTIGIHSTTRGERENQETLGGRKILMFSDYGRLDLVVRNVEQLMEDWYNAFLHMVKVYSTEAVTLANQNESIDLYGEAIPSNVSVMVKKGSTLPIDRPSKMNQAIQLSQSGMIDPLTLFEEMGYANADKRVQALYQWLSMTGKIAPQAQPAQGGEQSGQLQRLNQMLSNPEIKNLPPEDQQQIVQQGRQILEQIKGQ